MHAGDFIWCRYLVCILVLVAEQSRLNVMSQIPSTKNFFYSLLYLLVLVLVTNMIKRRITKHFVILLLLVQGQKYFWV